MELEQLTYQVQGLQSCNQLVLQTPNYVDAQLQGLDVKQSVELSNQTELFSAFANGQTVDGVTATNDRILIKDQSTGSENGIYTVNASSRPSVTDFDANSEVTGGIFAEEGHKRR